MARRDRSIDSRRTSVANLPNATRSVAASAADRIGAAAARSIRHHRPALDALSAGSASTFDDRTLPWTMPCWCRYAMASAISANPRAAPGTLLDTRRPDKYAAATAGPGSSVMLTILTSDGWRQSRSVRLIAERRSRLSSPSFSILSETSRGSSSCSARYVVPCGPFPRSVTIRNGASSRTSGSLSAISRRQRGQRPAIDDSVCVEHLGQEVTAGTKQ